MSTNAFVSCPACKFLVATDSTVCRWCNADLVALRAEQTKLKPPPPGAQPLEAVLKGRKARKLIPPPPVLAPAPAPLTAPVPSAPAAPAAAPPPPPLGRPANAPPAPRPTISPEPVTVPIPVSTAVVPPPPVGRAAVLTAPGPTVLPGSARTGATVPPPPPSLTQALSQYRSPSPYGAPSPHDGTAPSPTETSAVAPRKRPTAAIAGTIALVAVLAGSSWVALGRNHAKSAPTTVASTAAPTSAPSTSEASSTVAAPADPLTSWVTYNAPDGAFSVKLPSDPKVTSSTVTVQTLQLPQTIYDAGTALIGMIHFAAPIPAEKADGAFAGGVAGFKASLTAAGATITNETTILVQGHRADQGQVNTTGGTAYYTIILGTQDVFELLSIGDPTVHQAMVGSLHLNVA